MGEPAPTARTKADEHAAALDEALVAIESEFALATGRVERIREACESLRSRLTDTESPSAATACRTRLASLLTVRTGPMAVAVFEFLEGEVRSGAAEAESLAGAMLASRDFALRARAIDGILAWADAGILAPRIDLARRLACAIAAERPAESEAGGDALARRAGRFLRALPRDDLPEGWSDPVEALFASGSPGALRRLAASVLDLDETPIPVARAAILFGADVVRRLAPYLEYTRATHREVVDLDLACGGSCRMLAADLERAAELLGRTLLGDVIAEVGWPRIARGITVRPFVGVSVDGSFPFAVTPTEARLLEACGSTRRAWTKYLVTAGGSAPREGEPGNGGIEEAIGRFRRYNVRHAEALHEILEVAPLDAAKARRVLALLDRIVEDYVALFGGKAEDASRLPAIWTTLRDRVRDGIALAKDEAAPLGAEVTRLVQMFEDPTRLEEVRTLHGLKRYLHQQGLRHAFGLFPSARAANRTVDLVVTTRRAVRHVLRKVRYLEFDPPGPAGGGERLPFPVAAAVEALGLRLLHDLADAPDIEVLAFGNEIQVYVTFRNHPVFVRMDLSPPLRGGMIDVEYFAVSQYEMDRHPDLSLAAIRGFFRRLGFDVTADGFRLHVRYDKERAFDLGDLLDKARSLFRALPHLMDLDWVIGSLGYPEPARCEIAQAWCDFLERWGLLPVETLLTTDRRGVLRELRCDPGGRTREVAWDGRGAYSDRFTGTPGADLRARLRGALEARGLEYLAGWEKTGGPMGQAALERELLAPIRAALAVGEAVPATDGPRAAPRDRFARVHESDRIAEILAEGGEAVRRAARTAAVVATVERHLRFRTSGSVQGYAVQRAAVPLRGGPISVFVLRDEHGIACLAAAVEGPTFWRSRPDPEGAWRRGSEIGEIELLERLRHDHYLGEGGEPAAPTQGDDLPRRLLTPNPDAPARHLPEERIVPAVPAAPGRVAGFARFGISSRPPREFEGSVVFAPAIRPEDAPVIRRAAGVVSTGGGILSHAGLLALEFGKPALIVEGRWDHDPEGNLLLTLVRGEYREEEALVGGYEVVRRFALGEREEAIREGDLVVVDAVGGSLTILGQDREALALHGELHHLERAAEDLARASDPSRTLVQRGRLLRAIHQLERLAGRLDRPSLARHAVASLLAPLGSRGSCSAREGRRRVLDALLRNPRCGQGVRVSALGRLRELRSRHEGLHETALRALPAAKNVFEVEMLCLTEVRLRRLLEDVADLVGACGLSCPEPSMKRGVEETARARLLELRERSVATVVAVAAGAADEAWKLPHLRRDLERLDAVLGAERSSRGGSIRRADLDALSARRVLLPGDGGAELAPLVGTKAANLGEIARVLGSERVPAWFAVTDRTFREILDAPAGHAAETVGVEIGSRGSLRCAVDAVLARSDLDPAHKSAAIRRLWEGVRIPEGVGREIASAYCALGGPADAGVGARPFVALRSSAHEEDVEAASWAGQFDTFLFVRGAEALLHHLKLAFAGLWSERAIVHREASGSLGGPPGGGVIVQRMVESRASGVLLTASLAPGRPLEVVINVGLGLGEGVVSGTVDVDQIHVAKESDLAREPLRFRYLVGDKRERVVFDARAGFGTRREETLYHQRLRPALEYPDLCELVRAAASLEDAYLQPLDIEFAFEGPDLRILQARPVAVFVAALREALDRCPFANPSLSRQEEEIGS